MIERRQSPGGGDGADLSTSQLNGRTAPRRRRSSTFGTTRKLPSGRWQASYNADGRRHWATFDAKADADVWLASARRGATTHAEHVLFGGDRAAVRSATAELALQRAVERARE